ncbi:MAG: hypothetical protein Kow00114_34960 [Kiloniellaceae bacterium]
MAKHTAKSKEAPDVPSASVVTALREATSAGAPTMEPSALMSETRLENEARPMMTPPSEVVSEEGLGEGITAWHNSKKVTAMWANASARNAFASVAGLGWKKLSNANDSSFLALTMLASSAEQTNSNCNLRIEADNEVHEIYVW